MCKCHANILFNMFMINWSEKEPEIDQGNEIGRNWAESKSLERGWS